MNDNHQEDLIKQIRDLLANFYDYTYLQRHPLAEDLIQPEQMKAQTRAKELRRILLDAIEQLNPGDNVPLRAPERRPYAILFGLYVEGTSQQEVADFIGISRRQLRRDRNAAIEAIASIVEDRLLASQEEGEDKDKEDLLKHEAARLAQQRESIAVNDLVRELMPMLTTLAEEREIAVTVDVPPRTILAIANRTLLRQALITLTTEVLTQVPLRHLVFEVAPSPETARVRVGLRLHPQPQARGDPAPALADALNQPPIQTLVHALDAELRIDEPPAGPQRVQIVLPIQEETTVLVVDDNASLFALFRRYAVGHHYRLIHAESVAQAIAALEETQPDLITLDLMMPHQDGWELLQTLKARPDTAEVPVIVCSVLAQPELAYQQGAFAYLKKPIEQSDLLKALARAEKAARAGA